MSLLTAVHAQFLPARGLTAAQLAVVVNDDEPNSVEVGEYYRKARGIPAANIVHVQIPHTPRKLDAEEFEALKGKIDAKLAPEIQAVLMVWTAPYAVECNSITAAYTLGLDSALCAKPCGPAKPSAYYNSPSARPYSELKLRLSMLLPTDNVENAKALIDRGVASGFSVPQASAYFLQTSDAARSSRARFFPRSMVLPQQKLTIKTMQADSIEQVSDIMLYQTGLASVPKLNTLKFLPGALADHLTSFGGDLLGERQMSSLRWLDAGATASYGTVSEPCNHWQKFPNSTVLLSQYLRGASAIEAYWKSVAWPAQGLFIGEPLAAPYRH
ncbi:TIGR03790 family protein [Pseudoduganella danionis]|uniref:TIGR03790 family protein n=1 Tax=Pseudoduganella danionis TaxID=1890295 RepID=A0ABW9SNF7_9BURK|nr:TIGR03790 family protein [Pseudoduganella danionis]MTW33405.1 TIGR03790 family protein [Pseudoduganella danionis]